MKFEKINLEEKVHLNYVGDTLINIMDRKQVYIALDTVKQVNESLKIKSINLGNESTIDTEEKWENYFTYSRGINTFKFDKDCVYITELGAIIYDSSYAEWHLYFYKPLKEDRIYKNLLDYFKPNLIEYTIKKEVDFTENCWECGNQLINGKCNICGCSDEINF